jgi:hypothetical protein
LNELSQRNSLYSYLYLKQAKISFFSFFILQNQRIREGRTVLALGGDWYQWEGEEVEKGDRRVNTV